MCGGSGSAAGDFDPYPEIIPEYTPIAEISGPDNKFVQGLKLIADTANLFRSHSKFSMTEDSSGRRSTGTFNGKTDAYFFRGHRFSRIDIQLVPQANARVWWGWNRRWSLGMGVFQPFAESATTWTTELTAFTGRAGSIWRYINVEYQSTSAITLAFTVDTGNGSIVPATITIPSSGGTQTKLKITVTGPNKWKLLGVSATSSSPFYLMKEGMEFYVRSWGSTGPYRKEMPFGGPTNTGAEV